ncbi:MAG: DUF3048 domain-containing protein [Patescibacteria group bacterium]|jgi:hypothetical protein
MGKAQELINSAIVHIKTNKRTQIIILITIVGLSIIGMAVAIINLNKPKTTPPIVNTNTAIVTVTEPVARQIDGIPVPANESNILPVAVMIENLASIRPQAGLTEANLIYEALAEGGITRFMAIYASKTAVDKIGPIRSARAYFVDLAEEYKGIYVHVGGSPQALGVLNSSNYVTDLNQFSYSNYFYRDTALNVAMEHTLFSNTELLALALRDLELNNKTGAYQPYKFKTNLKKESRPTTTKPLVIYYSNKNYLVDWRYDRDSNSYLRWNGESEHRDVNNNEQIKAKNIVIQYIDTTVIDQQSGRLEMNTIGTGEAILVQDGISKAGTWKKEQRGDRTLFYDDTGAEFTFNPGQTWIELVPTADKSKVSY